jgi:hypothetical protein
MLRFEPGSVTRPCTCEGGICPACRGTGRVPCAHSAAHRDGLCRLCDGTGEHECIWCHGSGRHALCGGTGVLPRWHSPVVRRSRSWWWPYAMAGTGQDIRTHPWGLA